MDEKLYDVRLIDYNIRKGILKKEDQQKFLKSLHDESSNADYIEIPEDNKVADVAFSLA